MAATIREVNLLGGGTVVIPPGNWRSGRIELKSHVNLHLAEGARLEMSGSIADYQPPVFTRHEGIEVMGAGAFIYANGETGIAITGQGTIIGPARDAAVRVPEQSIYPPNDRDSPDLLVEQRLVDGQEGRTFYRPETISPIRCTNVLIEGIHIEQAAFWNVCPIYCQNVIIRGITVESVGVPSGDGIDIESCRDVLIEYCTLSCGDDCFTLKAGRGDDGLRVGLPTDRVVIRHCLALEGHGGLTCGSETAGQIQNVYLHDCVMDGTRVGIRFKTRRTRGGGIHDILCERVRMDGVGKAFEWDLLGSVKYMGELAHRCPVRRVNRLTPEVHDIHIRDFVVDNADQVLTLHAIPERPCGGVLIERGSISSRGLMPAIHDVDGLTLRHVDITAKEVRINILDGRHILLDDVDIRVPGGEVQMDIQGDLSEDIVYRHRGTQTVCVAGTSLKVSALAFQPEVP